MAKLLHAILTAPADIKLSLSYLEEESGLPFRQVRNRLSLARAMGIIASPPSLKFTQVGALVAEHDIFFESAATLEYLHYLSATNYKNLIWYETFNHMLPDEPPGTYEDWLRYFRTRLAEDYTEHSLKDHLGKEVRFTIDAYTNNNFKKLQLLYEGSDGRLARRRYAAPQLEVLAAMIYDYGMRNESTLIQVHSLVEDPGSPGLVFAIDLATMVNLLEGLHGKGWIRLESTHNLNQVRLLDGFAALEFMQACYERREPEKADAKDGGKEGHLL